MREHRIFYIFSLAFRLLLDAIYAGIISSFFMTEGFENNVNLGSYVVSWLLFVMFSQMLSSFLKKENSLISNLVVLLFLVKIVPFTSYIAFNPSSVHFVLLQVIYFSLILLLFRIVPPVRISKIPQQGLFINIITFVFVVTIVYLSGSYANFRLHFSLKDVYALRMEAREYDIPLILSYIHGAAVKVLPIILIYYIQKKDWIVSAIIILALLFSFGIDGMKSTFLNLILCLGLYVVRIKHIMRFLPVALTSLCILACGEYVFQDSYFLTDLFVRRVFFVPTLLDTFYYQYALDFGPIYFNSMVDGVDISFVIGDLWRTGQTRANNGLFSDAFVNLGFWGVIVYPILYAIFFKWAEGGFDKKDNGIVFYAAFIMVYNMISSFFSVCLLTHGMFLLCLVVMFMPQTVTSNKIIQRNL